MRVKNVLESKASSAIHTITSDATVIELLDTLAELNVGALIVSADGKTLDGIVSERDIVRKLRGQANPSEVTVAQIMTNAIHTCSPEDTFDHLMAMMTDNRVRHIPVLEDGELVGIVSIGDAVKHRIDRLEFERDQLSQYVSG